MHDAVKKYFNDTLEAVTVSRAGYDVHFITAHADRNGNLYSMFDHVAEFVKAHDAQIVSQFVFGGCGFHGDGILEIERASGHINWPVTWMQGDSCNGADLSGTQLCAVGGVPLKSLEYEQEPVGMYFEDEYAWYCILGDVRPSNIAASREAQTRETFEKMERVLGTVGMDFSHVVRTWMYLDRLLEWYGPFNQVRTQFFEERGVFERLVPASTGIGVCNPAGAALITDAFAVKPKDTDITIEEVVSPLQCSATDYKSSFSRAVEIGYPDYRRLMISGTASITPDGKTAHPGDTKAQIELTMEVVREILISRDMDWEDTTRAICYFKDMRKAPLYTQYSGENNLPKFPVALAHADVCRDDLLFEIELDVVSHR
jgi:enamine deaminase RidA (YjgF/YER057c/UK114 family)